MFILDNSPGAYRDFPGKLCFFYFELSLFLSVLIYSGFSQFVLLVIDLIDLFVFFSLYSYENDSLKCWYASLRFSLQNFYFYDYNKIKFIRVWKYKALFFKFQSIWSLCCLGFIGKIKKEENLLGSLILPYYIWCFRRTDNAIPIKSWFSDPMDLALLNLLPVLDALRFTHDVRSVLSRNLHLHRLW